MSMITLSMHHGQNQDEARTRLEAAVGDLRKLFGSLIQEVNWSDDKTQVRINGAGFWLDLRVDAQDVHATGDIAMLGRLLRAPLTAGLKRIMQDTFHKQLP